MSTDINNPAYSTLNTYAVLADSGITTVNTTTITNGSYGTPGATGITGTFVGTLDGANAITAQTELTALVGAINAATTPLTSTPLGTITSPITLYPNINYNGAGITFQGIPIILDAGGNSNAQFFITSSSGIIFNNVPSITLINGASTCNIFWLTVSNSAITFTGTMPASIPGIFIGGSQVTFVNAPQILGRVYAQTANVTFSGTSSVNATCTVVCYLKGTLILTQRGLVPVEKLKAGQSIVTKGKINFNKYHNKNSNIKVETLLWVSKFKVVDLNSKSRPICIKKDALGENKPFKDLYVSPGHSLLLNGEMVRANRLINGTTIYQDNDCDDVEYYHVELDSHSAVFANGILAESYLALNNRHVFENSISLRRKQTHNLKNIHAFR